MVHTDSMRGLLASICLLICVSRSAANIVADLQYAPFSNPLLDRDYSRPDAAVGALVRRGSCPTSYDSCSSVGNSGVCCPSDYVCQLDSSSQVACCPTGFSCTGTLGSATATGSTSTTGSTVVVGTTSSGTAASTASSTITATGSASTISGAAYPFPYIPTSFSNALACSSYYTECQSEYVACTSYLGSGETGYAVTISGVTGLVTAAGATTSVPTQSVTAVCSSLSQEACYGLQLSDCPQYGTASATGTTVGTSGAFVVTTAGAAPQMTGCPAGMYAMGAGVAFGVVELLG